MPPAQSSKERRGPAHSWQGMLPSTSTGRGGQAAWAAPQVAVGGCEGGGWKLWEGRLAVVGEAVVSITSPLMQPTRCVSSIVTPHGRSTHWQSRFPFFGHWHHLHSLICVSFAHTDVHIRYRHHLRWFMPCRGHSDYSRHQGPSASITGACILTIKLS